MAEFDIEEDVFEDETREEAEARKKITVRLTAPQKALADKLIDTVLMPLCDRLSGNPFRPYQIPLGRRIFESMVLNDGDTITGLFSRQSGKALALDTPIRTEQGWSTMENIQLGDRVYAVDGTLTEVSATSEVFMDHECFEVTFGDGQKIVADGWHRWTVWDSKAKQEVTVTTEEIARTPLRSPYYRYRVHMPAPVEGTEMELPLAPYLLGAWLGDGSSTKAEITTADWDVAQAFLDAGYELSYADAAGGKSITYGFTGGVYKAIRELGLFRLRWDERQLVTAGRSKKTDGVKHIPEIYLSASVKQRLELLRGLMDTDGHCTNHGEVEFSNTSKQLAEDVLWLVRSLGWKATIREARATLYGKDCGPKYRVCWTPYQEMNPFHLPRKATRVHVRPAIEWRARKTESTPIVSVVPVPSVPTKCIAVKHPKHLYLAGRGMIPTHNTETVADCVATAMIILPRLAKLYGAQLPSLNNYKDGVWVGAFGPVDEQADNLFGRIVARLSSDEALLILKDKEIDDEVKGRGKYVYLVHCGSLVRKTTCHPKAKIEGRTYHVILIDEVQDGETKTIKKSVNPMGAATNATRIWTGTPTYTKGIFYAQIQTNKREALKRGRSKTNHFEVDWRTVAKYVPQYERFVLKEMRDMGAESDEFRLSYKIEWLLDKGMFTTSEEFNELSDISVQALEKSWHWSQVCVGIDCARRRDRTVVTVVWVRWDQKDSMGYMDHRILNWLDLEGMKWEEQYFQIAEFLAKYNVYKVGVDIGGIGDVVIDRLRRLMPGIEFVEMGDAPAEQSKRWKYLKQLKERRMIKWPAGAKVRKLKVFRRFEQDMIDAELEYKGPNIKVAAPEDAEAHDDYVDSLAMACVLTREPDDNEAGQMVVMDNMFFKRSRRQ